MHPLPHFNNVTQKSDLDRNPESVTSCVTLSKFSCPQILLCDVEKLVTFARDSIVKHVTLREFHKIFTVICHLYNTMFPGMFTLELRKCSPVLCQSQPIESDAIGWERLGALMLMMDLPHNMFS